MAKITADRTINLDATQTKALEENDIRQAFVLVSAGNEIDVDRLAEVGCTVGEDGKIIVGEPCYTTMEELEAATVVDAAVTPEPVQEAPEELEAPVDEPKKKGK